MRESCRTTITKKGQVWGRLGKNTISTNKYNKNNHIKAYFLIRYSKQVVRS